MATKNKTERVKKPSKLPKAESKSPTLSYLMFHAIKEAGATGVWFQEVMKNINSSMPTSYSIGTYYNSLSKLVGSGVVTTQYEQRLKGDGSGHFIRVMRCFYVSGTTYKASASTTSSKYRAEQNVTWKPAGTWKAPEARSIPNSVFDFAAKLDN